MVDGTCATETLLVGDLASCRLSEVPWKISGGEKYYFENPLCCLVFNAGELSVIEYGNNEVYHSIMVLVCITVNNPFHGFQKTLIISNEAPFPLDT